MANVLVNKRIQIDKETRTMIIAASVATFVVMFCIFSVHTLASVMSYQNRVISQETLARNTLESDIKASNNLGTSYAKFNNTSGNNLLGASVSGNGPNQGDNAKLVLDALPSDNDYSGMVVNIQNLFTNQSVTLSSLSVTNTESTTTPAATATATVGHGSAVALPFTFTVNGTLPNISNLFQHLSQSILPIQITSYTITASSQNTLALSATAQTYYQPAISFMITTETVK
jgi:hypothetical protein